MSSFNIPTSLRTNYLVFIVDQWKSFISIDRPDIIKVRDLTTDKISSVHASRLRPYKHPVEMTKEEIEVLSPVDLDEYYVEKIVAHEGKVQKIGASICQVLQNIKYPL